jgi:hypothetical protein
MRLPQEIFFIFSALLIMSLVLPKAQVFHPKTEDICIFFGAVAFWIGKTRQLKQHSIVSDDNKNLLISALTGIVIGMMTDFDADN